MADMQLIVCSMNGIAYVWKYSDTYVQPKNMFHAHEDYILSCKVSANNKFLSEIHVRSRLLATASADRTIKLWDMNTMEMTSKLTGHEVVIIVPDNRKRYVWDVCFSCDSKNLVSCSVV